MAPPDDSALPVAEQVLTPSALLTLAAWLSPAYPVGAFAYSQGLEWAIEAGRVGDAATAEAWIADCIGHGAGRTDAILLAEAWRAAGDPAALADLAEFARALSPSAERLAEIDALGAAFAEVTGAAWGGGPPAPYLVALGRDAAAHGLPLAPVLALFLQAMASNLVSACQRLMPLGQTEGQRVLARLIPLCLSVAEDARTAGLDGIGSATVLADIASMRHETQTVRLFKS